MEDDSSKKQANPIKNFMLISVTIIMLLGIPKLSGIIADQMNYQYIDPDGAFVWISVHHIVQMLIFLLIMVTLMKIKHIDFQLTTGNRTEGIKSLKAFTLIFFIYSLISFTILYFTEGLAPFQYPLNSRNIIGYLGFQLLLSGPSEELIFRAFAMTIFAIYIPGSIKESKISKPNFLAAIIFALAHVGISFTPFSLTYSVNQLFLSFGLGLIYGYYYEKTKSVLYPMLLHSISNVIMVSFTIIFTVLLL